MKKILAIALAGAGVLLLVIGFTSGVAKATTNYRSFCPIDCSVYISGDGSLLLTPIVDTAPQTAELNGKKYSLKALKQVEMNTIVKNECAKVCTIYKIDGGKAVAAYQSSI